MVNLNCKLIKLTDWFTQGVFSYVRHRPNLHWGRCKILALLIASKPSTKLGLSDRLRLSSVSCTLLWLTCVSTCWVSQAVFWQYPLVVTHTASMSNWSRLRSLGWVEYLRLKCNIGMLGRKVLWMTYFWGLLTLFCIFTLVGRYSEWHTFGGKVIQSS